MSVVAVANFNAKTEMSNRYKVSGVAVSGTVHVLREGVFCVSHGWVCGGITHNWLMFKRNTQRE